tara:strand:+ start:415 stop:1737 length:1323 start_codon:yes stop_codon:yes gene_type:complete
MGAVEPQVTTETKLKRIAWLSSKDSSKEFTALMHHFNEESLEACFYEIDGRKSVGVDGVDKKTYGDQLKGNLKELIARMKRMAYRPGPVREVQIPKDGKPKATRPLGISNFEDKLVQKMTKKVLESIYEPTFLSCSFGFRPGLGCHDAIRALMQHLYANEVGTVIDVDISNFFGTIDHSELEGILRSKIKDPVFMRYIIRMFKSGVLKDNELIVPEGGVAQGSGCSPILANIYADHVIDQWFETVVKQHCRGKVEMFRYCDDMVICCQYQLDGERIKQALVKRLGKFKLSLNEDKTRSVSFSKRQQRQGVKQGVFDFLGFTIFLSRSRKGVVIPKLKTSGKKFRAKLKNIKTWIKDNRSRHPTMALWSTLCSKLRGHIRYYGVSHNFRSMSCFIYRVTRIMFKWLNRRSQKKSITWDKFNLFMGRFPLPRARVYHRLFYA